MSSPPSFPIDWSNRKHSKALGKDRVTRWKESRSLNHHAESQLPKWQLANWQNHYIWKEINLSWIKQLKFSIVLVAATIVCFNEHNHQWNNPGSSSSGWIQFIFSILPSSWWPAHTAFTSSCISSANDRLLASQDTHISPRASSQWKASPYPMKSNTSQRDFTRPVVITI